MQKYRLERMLDERIKVVCTMEHPRLKLEEIVKMIDRSFRMTNPAEVKNIYLHKLGKLNIFLQWEYV